MFHIIIFRDRAEKGKLASFCTDDLDSWRSDHPGEEVTVFTYKEEPDSFSPGPVSILTALLPMGNTDGHAFDNVAAMLAEIGLDVFEFATRYAKSQMAGALPES